MSCVPVANTCQLAPWDTGLHVLLLLLKAQGDAKTLLGIQTATTVHMANASSGPKMLAPPPGCREQKENAQRGENPKSRGV